MTRQRHFNSPRDPRTSVRSTTVRLREPVDVLAVIPYVIGYHQQHSVVVIGLSGTRLLFAARDEIPPEAVFDRMLSGLEQLRDTVTRQDVDAVIIAGYGRPAQIDPVVAWLREAFAREQVEVLEALRVSDGRYWSYLCGVPSCCPPDGTPYDLATSAIAAQATVVGRVALPDQQAFEAQVRPVTGPARTAMRVATARADERMSRLLAKAADEPGALAEIVDAATSAMISAHRVHAAGGLLTDDDVAWLTLLLVSTRVRDLAWETIMSAGDDLELHRGLWLEVMRRAEPDLMPAPGTLFAFASWRCGASTLARLALTQVLDNDPDYEMARLLDRALAHGLPPWALDDPAPMPLNRRAARRPHKRSSTRRVRIRRE